MISTGATRVAPEKAVFRPALSRSFHAGVEPENDMSDFFAKYKHPRWQQRRLEIFQRDGYTCQQCRATEKTLHVHHKIYRKNADPWDYSDTDLITLCEDCHETAGEHTKALKEALALLHPDQFERVLGFVEAMTADDACQSALDRVGRREGYEQLRFPVRSFHHLFGYFDYFRLSEPDGITREQATENLRLFSRGTVERRGYLTIDELLTRKLNGEN